MVFAGAGAPTGFPCRGTRPGVDPVWAARGAALVLMLGAGGLFVLARPAPAIVLAATAAGLVFLARREPPVQVSGLAALEAIVADLGLEGPGHHLPGEDGVVRLFIPADEHPRRLPRSHGHALGTRPGEGIGLLVPSVGQDLETAWARVGTLPRGGGPQGAAHAIRQALPALGLARDVHVAVRDRSLEVAYAAPPQPGSDQIGRPTDALCAMLACRAFRLPVRYAGHRRDGDHVRLVLEAVPWP